MSKLSQGLAMEQVTLRLEIFLGVGITLLLKLSIHVVPVYGQTAGVMGSNCQTHGYPSDMTDNIM